MKTHIKSLILSVKKYCQSIYLSNTGFLIGSLFVAASLTPSLLPRHFIVQGFLSGFSFVVGYGFGSLLTKLWYFLELPKIHTKWDFFSRAVTYALSFAIMIFYFSRSIVWQNSIRHLMEMRDLSSTHPWFVLFTTTTIVVLCFSLINLFKRLQYYFDTHFNRVTTKRISFLSSVVVTIFFIFLLFNKIFLKPALDLADIAFSQIDMATDEKIESPKYSGSSGGPNSLIDWESIGYQGKVFLSSSPKETEISAFWGEKTLQPLRVYIGLRSASTVKQRAEVALKELIRFKAFEKSILVIAVPTGTGWLDPGAVDTIEFIHRGDSAIVSIQYSYLPSWITILLDPQRCRETASALFDEVYGYWKTLPKAHRPKLYIHGLSLGSLCSESSADLFTVYEDPIHGGVWSGPPFPSSGWAKITHSRNKNSPSWLPTFRDQSIVRFMGQKSRPSSPEKRWGPMRFVYIQHASDPMTFFSPSLAYSKPDWLIEPKGPDVSSYFQWYPLVTFLQVAFDLPSATSVPHGYGHNYAPSSYIDAWIEVTQPRSWTPELTDRLKQLFLTREQDMP